MTERADIEELVAQYIRCELLRTSGFSINPEENLFTGGYVDSVGIMRLIAFVEARLGLTIPPTDLVPGNFRTVRTMATYLAERLNGGEATAPRERQAGSA